MKKYFLILLVGLLMVPGVALAQWGAAKSNLTSVADATGLASDLPSSVGTIISAALSLVGTIFLVLTIYAGILWMTASGNEDQVGKAKKIITAAIIGLVITMAAYAITSFVTGRLGGGSEGGGTTTTVTPTDKTTCEAAGGSCAASCGTGTESFGICGQANQPNVMCCKTQ